MKAAVQVLKQADELKAKVSGDILNDNEAWTCHQQLQDLYQQLLVMDLEYALDKKVEQDLWNYVFKNQINTLQNQAKDKKNPHRTESQGNLAWFLEAASGFYLQLLQELCDAFDLDLPCRRKGSVYGIIKGSKPLNCKITPPQKSSSLYVCQHCLVHLGDIARYRSQSLQAETFYRHAAQLVPSNGQPYNQLAILEAAKGEKLSTVFYYVRSIAVKHPFPVAATNLQKMFSKIASDELSIEGKAKLSVYDYINTFLQFHGLIHMASDLERASKLLRVLSANLSTLVATESLSSWKLIQMTAINLFALAHATRSLETPGGDKRDSDQLSDDEKKVHHLMLELLASMLNGLLLLVYTMKDEQTLKDFYALPIIKLILDWVRQEVDVLQMEPFAHKLQIWPSLCKLLNGIQLGTSDTFDANKYQDVPLPEDWDLQCFLPLAKTHKQYKFKESTPRWTEEEESKLRAHRLICHGQWICEQEVAGKKLMTSQAQVDGSIIPLSFEAIIQEAPSSDVLMQLEEVSVCKTSRNGHLLMENHGDSSSNSVSSQEAAQSQEMKGDSSTSSAEGMACKASEKGGRDKMGRGVMKEKGNKLDGKLVSRISDDKNKDKKMEKPGIDRKENNRPGIYGRERKTRQNVAMQTIMQKKNISTKIDVVEDGAVQSSVNNMKPKLETKQVTFKTPSPSPPASSEGTPPQTATPPQPANIPRIDLMSNFPPLQSIYPQLQPVPTGGNYVGGPQATKPTYNLQPDSKPGGPYSVPNRMAMSFPGPVQNQNSAVLDQNAGSPSQSYPSTRMVPSSLPTAGYHHTFGPPPSTPQGNDYQVPGFRNQMKDPMTMQQPGPSYSANRMGMHGSMMAGVAQQPFLYGFGPGQSSGQPLSPGQQKQAFTFGEGPMFGQQIQWFQPAPIPMQGIKNPNMDHSFLPPNQGPRPNQLSPSQMEVSPQGTAQMPPQSQTFQIFASQPAQTQPAPPQRGQIPENLVFQMQTPAAVAYSFQSPLPPRLSQPNPLGKLSGEAPPTLTSVSNPPTSKMSAPVPQVARLEGDGPAGNGEVIPNTYSLFNSPWSSGLNLSPTTTKEAGVSLATTTAPPSGTNNFGNFVQPGLQSLWSGPGPSPLERLLEQQKQKRDTAPQ